jgi:hypothetical protein
MNCPDCLDRLQRQLDGAPPPDPAALHSHLTSCPACQGWFAAAQRLTEGLRTLTVPPPPANLTDRIVAEVLSRRRARLRTRRWLAVGTAVAAALLLTTLAGLRWFHQEEAGPQAPQPRARQETRPPEAVAPSLRESVAEARSAVAALTDDLAAKTTAQAKMLWNSAAPLNPGPMPPLPDMGDLEQPLEPAAQSLRASGQGVAASLQSVASSAQRAFSFFLRELPVEPERKTGL